MLTCTIVSENEHTTWEQLQSLTVPLTSGEATFLAGHAELFEALPDMFLHLVLIYGFSERDCGFDFVEAFKNDVFEIVASLHMAG